MIDIHCHVIPGVDDGAKSYEMALAMLRQAHEEGIQAVIATPHCQPERWEYNVEVLREKTEELQRLAAKNGLSIPVYLGSELKYRCSLAEDLREKRCLTMAGGHYVLLEFDYGDSYRVIDRGITLLQAEGYCPILAHVERYNNLRGRFNEISHWIENGLLIQCNASAVSGKEDFQLAHFTRKLLSYDMVHLIATDAHSDTWRRPAMAECLNYLQKKIGDQKIRQLTEENPLKIIHDEDI